MLAWIPDQTEPDCTYLAFYTKWITDGSYTEWAALPPGNPYAIPESWRGKTIDMAWVDAYVRRCFIMYVASLAELDNPTRIVLMPPTNLIKGDFTFGKAYNLSWKPDVSMLLLFNHGQDHYFSGSSRLSESPEK
jgi:hypothetical protein